MCSMTNDFTVNSERVQIEYGGHGVAWMSFHVLMASSYDLGYRRMQNGYSKGGPWMVDYSQSMTT